jgi:pilus assembly protein CpaF
LVTIPDYVFAQTLKSLFEPIRFLLEDDTVSEILINGHDEIYIERRGTLARADQRFASEYELLAALRNLSQYVGRAVGEQLPILEARLPDGSRVEAVVPPAAPGGPAVAIRKFQGEHVTLKRLHELGSVSLESMSLLRSIVKGRRNVLVGGGSGAGKTSLLNALTSSADPHERVIVIEDSTELQITLPHVVRFESQPADAEGRGAITIRELLRATLRMRPDRIVIGEIRGSEALDLIQAMTSGHRGCLSTVHGTLPVDTLRRLETMALMSDVEMPVGVLRGQIASAVDVIVQVARSEDGFRQVTHITEVQGVDSSLGYRLLDLVGPSEAP